MKGLKYYKSILYLQLIILILISIGMGLISSSTYAQEDKLTITSWYSRGGNPVNKDSEQDLMYLVKEGDTIEFSVTVNKKANFIWEVNKVEQGVNSNTFTFKVPNEKGIWEIHVKAYTEDEEAHHEWVISTLSEDEAPTIFDYFTDKKSYGRTEKDPWNRPLPEWSGEEEYAPHASKGFVDSSEGITYSSTPSTIAYGTWKFKYRFPEAMRTCGGEGISFTYISTSGEDWGSFSFSQCCDSHHHCVISHSEADFSIDYDDGVVLRDKWYTVTIIRTREGWIYVFRDDKIEFLVYEPKIEKSESISLRLVSPSSPKRYFDCLEVYADKYLFPNKGIIYGEYVSAYYSMNYKNYPIKKHGIIVKGRGITLSKIAEEINDPSLFTYDPDTRTAICYTNLVLDEGAELTIENEVLKFHCDYDGELEFVLKYASELFVRNSIITSTNEHYWVWNLASTTTHYGYEIKLEEGREPDYYDFVMVLACSYHGRFIVENSIINNTAHLFFDSPYELRIVNTKILNLHEIDIGNYTFIGSYEDAVKDMKTFLKGKKGLWIYTDDINLCDFTLRGVDIRGAEPTFNLTLLINAHRDKLNLYDVDIGEGNIIIKESLAQTYRQSHDCYSNGPPYNWKSYLDSGIGLVNCRFKDVFLTPGIFTDCDGKPVRKFVAVKYYLDIKVVDANGNPVPNAKVVVVNEIDNFNFPPENLAVIKPYTGDLDALDGGEYAGFYHHFRIIEGIPLNYTYTGSDGHTPLPSDPENTIVLTDYVKKIEDSYSGIKISWVSHQGAIKYIKFDLYDEHHGNILHLVKYLNLKKGDKYHVKVVYDPDENTISLLITDEGGNIIWNTGEIKIMAKIGLLDLDQIAFEVRKKDATNDISWENGHIKVDTSVYRGRIRAYVDNMKIIANGTTIEDNDYSNDPGLKPIDENVIEYYDLSKSTGGESFIWEFDIELDEFDIDGPWISIWLRDGKHTPDPNEKIIDYTYTITVSKNGKNVTIHGFNIDSSWYRDDPNTPIKTLVINLDSGEWWIEEKEIHTQKVELEKGWNLISVVVKSKTPYKASDLAEDIGAKCRLIAKWDSSSQKYTTYIPGFSSEEYNFEIESGYGYFVYLDTSTIVELSGTPVQVDTIELKKGWNLVGWDRDEITAKEIAQSIGGECKLLAKWISGEQKYITYIPGFSPEEYNFRVKRGEAIFIYMEKEKTWTKP